MQDATVQETSEVRRLFEAWRRAKTELRDAPAANADDDDEIFYKAVDAAEEALFAARPATMADLALKIIAADDDGDMAQSITQRQLVREAYEIAGVDGWTDEDEADPALAASGRRPGRGEI